MRLNTHCSLEHLERHLGADLADERVNELDIRLSEAFDHELSDAADRRLLQDHRVQICVWAERRQARKRVTLPRARLLRGRGDGRVLRAAAEDLVENRTILLVERVLSLARLVADRKALEAQRLRVHLRSQLASRPPKPLTVMADEQVVEHVEQKAAAVRSAEKDRTSTCAFADRVAACVLDAYRQHAAAFEAERRSAGRQTVVAGICALDGTCDPPVLACVSWGCGTKFLRRELIDEDAQGLRVRDGHAEVLARRGLLDALYAELEASILESTAVAAAPDAVVAADSKHAVSSASTGHSVAAAPASTTVGMAVRPCRVRLLEPMAPVPGAGAPCWRLRRGVSLHLYSSSQPCGNASLKKWAKGKAEVPHPALGEYEWPRALGSHAKQHWPQQSIGQVATLVKKEESVAAAGLASDEPAEPARCDWDMGPAGAGTDEAAEAAPAVDGSRTEEAGAEAEARAEGAGGAAPNGSLNGASGAPLLFYPPGTVPCGGHAGDGFNGYGHAGRTHTCSDKICRWQCLGLQGGLLAHFLPEPLALATVTVGRKFHRACLERALCCRAQDFVPAPDQPPAKQRRRGGGPRLRPPDGYRVQHAAMLCTALKLDPNTAICTAATEAPHASFVEPRVLWWSAAATAGPEILDGTTGLPLQAPASAAARVEPSAAGASFSAHACSRVSSARLLSRFVALCERTGRRELVAQPASLPASAKRAYTPYAQAREALLSDERHLGIWQAKQGVGTAPQPQSENAR